MSDRDRGLSEAKRRLLHSWLAGSSPPPSARRSIPPRRRGGAPPPSYQQEQMWNAVRRSPSGPGTNTGVALDLRGPLEPDLVRRVLEELIMRHEGLRSTFPSKDGRASVRIDSEPRLGLETVDFSRLDANAADEAIAGRIDAEMAIPFDHERGPLYRATLFRVAPELHVLLLVVDHLIVDGWSYGIFLREFQDLYTARRSGGFSPLPDLAIGYGDYAAWQRKELGGDALEDRFRYWDEVLSTPPTPLMLSARRRAGPAPSYRGETHDFRLPTALLSGVRSVSRRHGVSPFVVLLTAFKALLHLRTGETDISVVVISSNRPTGTESVMGLFANLAVARTDLSGDPAGGEALLRVAESVKRVLRVPDLPFRALVDRTRARHELGDRQVFFTMFVLQNFPMPALNSGDLDLSIRWIDFGGARLDLTLLLMEKDAGMAGFASVNGEVLTVSESADLIRGYDGVATALVEHPERRLSELPCVCRKPLPDR